MIERLCCLEQMVKGGQRMSGVEEKKNHAGFGNKLKSINRIVKSKGPCWISDYARENLSPGEIP